MKCPKCSAEMEEGLKFCPQCGEELEKNEAADQETMPVPVPEEPKKKSKTGVIIGAAAAVIVLAGILFVLFGKTDPKEAVIGAFRSLYEETTYPIDELFGFEEMMERSSEENYESELSLVVESVDDPDLSILTSGGMTVKAATDVENNSSMVSMGLQYGGMDLVSMEVYADGDMLMVQVPEMSDTIFTLDLTRDLAEQVAASPYLGQILLESYGMTAEDFKNYVDALTDAADPENGVNAADPLGLLELWSRYKEGSQAIENLKAAMTAEKGDKKTLTVDGAEVSCQGYRATIPAADLAAFIETTYQFIAEDESFKEQFFTYMRQSLMSYSYQMEDISQLDEELEAMIDDMGEGMDTFLDELLPMLGDVTMNVYVDKKGRMAGFDLTTTLTGSEAGETLDVAVDYQSKGGAYLTQNEEMVITLVSEGKTDEAVTVAVMKQGEYDGKTLTGDMDITITDSGVMMANVSYSGTYNSDGGDYHIYLSLGDGIDQAEFDMTGVISSLEKGKSIDATVDSMNLKINQQQLVDLSGNFRLAPLTGEITKPEGTQMDMLAATEEDWQTVLMEFYGYVFGLMIQMQ